MSRPLRRIPKGRARGSGSALTPERCFGKGLQARHRGRQGLVRPGIDALLASSRTRPPALQAVRSVFAGNTTRFEQHKGLPHTQHEWGPRGPPSLDCRDCRQVHCGAPAHLLSRVKVSATAIWRPARPHCPLPTRRGGDSRTINDVDLPLFDSHNVGPARVSRVV